MVRRVVTRWSLAVTALTIALGAGRASADKISDVNSGLIAFTGDVERDMGAGVVPGSQIVSGGPANRVAQAQWMTNAGWVSGWAMKDVRFHYDNTSDTLQVGINFYGIAGDSDGNGDPGGADPRTVASGGVDLANLGGRKSITLALAPDGAAGKSAPGTSVLIAGVPTDKSKSGPGVNGFNVTNYVAANAGISYGYGQTLANHLGTLAFNPSKDRPDFQFSIRNFSKIPGLNPSSGFWFQVFAGSPDDVVSGEQTVGWARINGVFSPQIVPEPTTLLAWGAVAGLAAWRLKRSRRSSS